MIFGPALALLIVGGLALFFRCAHGVLVPSAIALFPLALLLGLMAYCGEAIGLLNQAYFTLIPALAIADSIHLLHHFHEGLERLAQRSVPDSWSERRREAIVHALRRGGRACSLTSLSTAAGFSALALSEVPVVRNFGLFAAAAIVFAWLGSIVLFPLLLSFLPERSRPLPASLFQTFSPTLAKDRHVVPRASSPDPPRKLARLLHRPRLRTEDEGRQPHQRSTPPSHPVRESSEIIDRELGGSLSLSLDLQGPPGSMREQAVLGCIGRFEDWASARPEVRSIFGPTPNPAISLVDSPLLRTVDAEAGRARVVMGVPDLGADAFRAFTVQARLRFDEYCGDQGIDGTFTGTADFAYRGVDRITRDLQASFASAFALVSLMILVGFRRLGLSLLSLLPNLFPLLIVYAGLAYFAVPLDPIAAVIFSLGIGIAVDDTIHFLTRYRDELEGGASRDEALETTLGSSGGAITLTSVVLMAGLAINLFSSFPPLRLLGAMGVALIGLAWLADISLLAVLLSRFHKPTSH